MKKRNAFLVMLCCLAGWLAPAHAAKVRYSASATYVPGGQGGGGLIQSITYPSGKTLTYQYDPTGLITTMLWNGQPVVANLQWNALELPTGWTWPFANTNATRVYNSAAQLQQSELFAYEFTPGGLVKKITQQLQAPMKQGAQTVSQPWTVVTNITHGIMGISDVTHTPGTITLPTGFVAQDIIGPLQASYTYDDNGNRTRAVYQQWGGSMGTNLLTRDMHLVAGTNKIGKVYDHRNSVQSQRTLTWDDSGRMTSDGDNTFHYDVMGRTTAITNSYGGGTLTFLTNALYQRTRKQQGNLVYDYFYGEEDWGMGQSSFPLGMYFTNKTTQQKKATEYLYLPTPMGPMPIAVDMGGTLYAIHTDHLLTPRRLTDSNGQAVWQWPVTAFGELEANNASTGWIRSRIGSAGAIANTQDVEFALRYPGQQFDKETGLMYNHHRYYDPYLTVGYTETDPIGLAGGWNRLRYAGGDGINNFDMRGLASLNLFQPGSNMRAYAHMWNEKMYYTVAGHGNFKFMQDDRFERSANLTPEKLAEIIKADPSWKNRPIILGSCNTGYGFAEELAKILRVAVTAPLGFAWFNYGGVIGVSSLQTVLPSAEHTEYYNRHRYILQWRTFNAP